MKTNPYYSVLLLIGTLAALNGEDIVSGPPVGNEVGSVRCYANSGLYAGREVFDAGEEIGQSPGAFLFIHVFNRNTAPLIRGVDNLAAELSLFGFKAFTVTLTNDRTSGEELIRRVNGSLKLKNPMVLSLDGLDGPGNLALNRRCTLSLVVVSDGKVTDSFGFTDTNLSDMTRIRTSFENSIGEIPTRPSELIALAKRHLPEGQEALRDLAARQALEIYRVRKKAAEEHMNARQYSAGREGAMRRGRNAPAGGEMERGSRNRRPRAEPADSSEKSTEKNAGGTGRARRGNPPDDPQLNSLLRSFIKQTNTNEIVDEIFTDIEKRSKEGKELGKEAISMFQLMLSYPDRYGSEHAQELARKFLTDRGEK
ncbi:MAG TPA: hypothetical protein EYQ50_11145 [Verrucomicrobiales bacterium]|nr:hypothetical protein [Verrucomicrobiales bacterium]